MREGFTEYEAAMALTMLKSAWTWHDIAAYFGKNQGRISSDEIEQTYPKLEPVLETEIPLRDAFSGKKSLSVLSQIDQAVLSIRTGSPDGLKQFQKIIDMRKYIGHKGRTKREYGESLSPSDASLALLMVQMKQAVRKRTGKRNTPFDAIAAFVACDSARIDELTNPPKYLKKSKEPGRKESDCRRCRNAYEKYRNLAAADKSLCPPMHMKPFYDVGKPTYEFVFPFGMEMDQLLCKIQDYLRLRTDDYNAAGALLDQIDSDLDRWEWRNWGEIQSETPEDRAWRKRRAELSKMNETPLDVKSIDIDAILKASLNADRFILT